jgi:hypothetical protein
VSVNAYTEVKEDENTNSLAFTDQNAVSLSFHTALSQMPGGLTSNGKEYLFSTNKPSEVKGIMSNQLLSEDE